MWGGRRVQTRKGCALGKQVSRKGLIQRKVYGEKYNFATQVKKYISRGDHSTLMT